MTTMKKRWPLAAVATAALIGGGCSNEPDENGSAANANTATQEQAVEFAQCMRDNGVSEFPDPDASDGLTIDGVLNGSALDPDGPAWQTAMAACKDLQPAGFTGDEDISAEQQETRLAFAECMRRQRRGGLPGPDRGFAPRRHESNPIVRNGGWHDHSQRGDGDVRGPRGRSDGPVKRKTWVFAGAAVLVAVIVGVFVLSGGKEGTLAAQEAPANTDAVERGELSAMVSLDGVLTYRARPDGSPYSAINQASGTYTELPAGGDQVDCGDVLYRVDDDPVLLLCGTVPAYRDLDEGDAGKDVRQLNRNLHELGYDADAGENEFTWETEDALEELQNDRGSSETGALGVDDAVFLPRPVRIAKVTGKLGGSASPGAAVAEVTSDMLEVQVNLDAAQQGVVREGERALITLPGNESVKGKVDRLGRVAQTAEEGDDVGTATIPAYISLDKPKQARELDRAPVQVDVTTKGVKRALSVPVTALVGSSGGGYAVEVVPDGGQRRLVAVTLGLFDTAAGRVAVKGDLHEGDQVVVPSE